MQIAAPDGRVIDVRRRWIPWHPKLRRIGGIDAFDIAGFADDPVSFLALFVIAILLALFGGIILATALMASEILLLLALLLPLLAAARMFWILPWVIEARYAETVLGTVGVRGWRDSGDKLREVASAYQRGQDPFEVTDYAHET
jgi:CBS domain containing-hemolysin-like protein